MDTQPLRPFSRLARFLARVPFARKAWDRLVANPKELRRFAKFAAVGGLGAVIDFCILNLMKRLFEAVGLGVGWQTTLTVRQVQLAAANAISFSAAVLSNFTWNRVWTFPESRQRRLGTQLAQFAVVNLAGLGINTVVLLLADRYVFQLFLSDRLSYNFAKALAIGVVLFWNFGINRIWTYRGIK